MPGILPNRCKLFSFQHNGQFVFVSNDPEGNDRVVEAHPFPDESRNVFIPEQVNPNEPLQFRFRHKDTGWFLFVSNDDDAGDNIVEAHPADEFRNIFEVRKQFDADTPFGSGGVFTFFSPQFERFLFLSNTRRGNDYVIEAHGAEELRNQFVVIEAPN